MKKFFIKENTNKILALFAIVLGFFGIFAGSPYKGASTTFSTKEIASLIDKGLAHISPNEIANWIIQGKSDFRLIDVRSEKDFAEYHIPTSENISLSSIVNSSLKKNEKIILYCGRGVASLESWFLLKANGYKNVYDIQGGLNAWKEKILFPKISENPTKEQLIEFEKIKEISKYFGGSPQTGVKSDSTAQKLAMPKLEMPSTQLTPATTGKKKKEGC